MKRTITTIIMLLSVAIAAFAQIRVVTPSTEMVLSARQGGDLQIQYFGGRLSDADAENLMAAGAARHSAYRAYGLGCASEASLGVTHVDGNMSTSLRVESVDKVSEPSAEVVRIRMKDTVYPFYVTVCYRAYQDVDMIES